MIARPRKIRVLVVDDSRLVREMIAAILAGEPDIQVVGQAADGREAVGMAAALNPDLITMDLEMPVMNGFEAIERIMADQPVPILVVTARGSARIAFDAIGKGALDLIEKPDIALKNAAGLVQRIRMLAGVEMKSRVNGFRRRLISARHAAVGRQGSNGAAIIAVAASSGGPRAIHAILAALPASFPLPIVIAQHNIDGFAQGMVDWLARETPLIVKLAGAGELPAGGRVYINPSEHSMGIDAQGRIVLGGRVAGRYNSPSCNTLLSSVAEAYRQRAVGVILSGMGDDGVAGMEAIKNAGGVTIAQDEASSLIYGMNQCAVQRGVIDLVLPLAEIPAELLRRAGC